MRDDFDSRKPSAAAAAATNRNTATATANNSTTVTANASNSNGSTINLYSPIPSPSRRIPYQHSPGYAPPPCRYYPLGQCIYGDYCRFNHDDSLIYSNDSTTTAVPVAAGAAYVDTQVASTSTSTSTSTGADGGGFTNRHSIPCRFWYRGYCRNGSNCPYSHGDEAYTYTVESTEHPEMCKPCLKSPDPGTEATSSNGDGTDHNETATKVEQDSNLKEDATVAVDKGETFDCNICYENIIETKKRFGLLSNCSHVFCLDCIMSWRDQYKKKNSSNNVNGNDTDPNDDSGGNPRVQQPSTMSTNGSTNNDTSDATPTVATGSTAAGNTTTANVTNSNNGSTSTSTSTSINNNNERLTFQPHLQNQMRTTNFDYRSNVDFIEETFQRFMNTIQNQELNNPRFTKENTHSCPICRIESKSIIPSYKYLEKEEKEAFFEEYKKSKATIPCRNFNGSLGSCPFGSECYYAHYDENGVDVKQNDFKKSSRPSRRRRRRGQRVNSGNGSDDDDDEDDDYGEFYGDFDDFQMFLHMVELGLVEGMPLPGGFGGFSLRVDDGDDNDEMSMPFFFNRNFRNVMHQMTREDDDNDNIGSADDDSLYSRNSMPTLQRRGMGHEDDDSEWDNDEESSSDGDENSNSDSSDDDSVPSLIRRNYSSSSDDDSDDDLPGLSNRRPYDSSSSDDDSDDSDCSIPDLSHRRDSSSSSDDSSFEYE